LTSPNINLPPVTGHAVAVDIYDGEVASDHHHECGVPPVGGVTLCGRPYEESRIYYGHVWIRGRDRECEAGPHRENETDQFEVERGPVTLETAKPE